MSFEELTVDRDFMQKLDETKSYKEAKELFAAEGVDLDAELKDVQVDRNDELTEEALEGVAGGFSIESIWTAVNGGLQIGVVIRNLWDKAHGGPLSYPNWKFEW